MASPPSEPSASSASSSAPPAATSFDAFLGLHKRNPLLAAVLLVLFLSLAGIPPLVGFWAKFNLFAAVLNGGWAGSFTGPLTSLPVFALTLVALAVAFSAVSLYYYLQVLKRVYVMPAADETSIRVPPGHSRHAAGNRRRCRRHGLLAGAAAKLDRELLSSDVTCSLKTTTARGSLPGGR